MSDTSSTVVHVKRNEVRVWERVIPDCSVVFDIGCREDTHFQDLAREGASIHMFDVNHETIEKLKRNLSPKPGVNLSIHSYGLGRTTRNIQYFSNTESAFYRPNLSDPRSVMTLQVKSVSDHVKDYPVEKIDFCKIDTEGYEIEILESLSEAGVQLSLIQFEVGSCWFEKEGRDVSIAFLADILKRYELYVIFDQRNPFFAGKDSVITRIFSIEEVLPFLDMSCGFDFLLPLNEDRRQAINDLLDLKVTDDEIDFAIKMNKNT